MPTASQKPSCRHNLKACRHMWRMATGRDNAALHGYGTAVYFWDTLGFRVGNTKLGIFE